MFQIDFIKIKQNIAPVFIPVILLFFVIFMGCGMRASNSGGIIGRVVDSEGRVIVNAKVVSIFDETQVSYSNLSGAFELTELPAGRHNIAINHPDYNLEQYFAEVTAGKVTDLGMVKLSSITLSDKISDVKSEYIASSSALITWKTDKERICTVIYGIDYNDYTKSSREIRASKDHELILTDLIPETLYHFRVQFEDESGSKFYSYDYSFLTGEADVPMKPSYVETKPINQMNQITVAWNAPISGKSVTGYNIYRRHKLVKRAELSDWIKLNEAPIDAKTFEFTDVTVESGKFYRYGVTAINQFGVDSEKEVTDMVFATGVINEETILTADDSPIELHADLIVAAGINLLIEAGTEILIGEKDSNASGLDEDRVELLVYGQLTVDGTAEKPVVFAPLSGSGRRDHWAGISIVTDSQLVSRISHTSLFGCVGYALDIKAKEVSVNNLSIAYSSGGLSLNGVRSVLDLNNCSFSEIASVAVNITDCYRVSLVNSVIKDAAIGVISFNTNANNQTVIRNTDIYVSELGIKALFGKGIIANTLVVCKEGTGILCENALSSSGNYIDHVTIDALNGIDIDSGNFTVSNNIIANTVAVGNTGIVNRTSENPIYNFNNVVGFNNLYQNCQKGANSVSFVPNFVGGNPYDYNLSPTSMLIFADEYQKELGRYGVSRY
ncbi:MAG: carboxypeptidase regulatory-like domain-containing protein [Candidatus Riflebacteria bacterium]|nr:carboxypeptidase regulatory-like domain-containing protein [Candidatus Riflebacteria bacterium]